ncbi:Mbov_0395 family pilin-like conjugal transfer protein [Mycoplasma sp. CSL7503-lung]|uniref:Mbov_0395 family pilin-like conjugal transfer protein n=1 Tax=Mycoplasma sp. CSL7503-lung TaxID=536372 RepID=UPI0021D19D3C|nr:pilin [Mycoplasma sp. CSL7503-lung]MCU4706435.1 pilin [Mycoplasma sp. CSL7503-lung]
MILDNIYRYMNAVVDDTAFKNVANQTFRVINTVFGVMLAVAGLLLIGAIIVAIFQNSHTTDPQKRIQNNKKIMWAIVGIVGLLFAWGIAAIIVNAVQASSNTQLINLQYIQIIKKSSLLN